ncbi:MAG: serine/threonine protein kinase [Verrucomicrobia bacterium]|nr:serine/threonine protein kinase [Verrucomicrobiota bacterium]
MALAPEDWLRAKEIFVETADLPANERPTRLDQLCGCNETLRAEVESLLASDATSSGFMAVPAGKVPRRLLAGSEWEGHRLGAYEIAGELGRGGLGVVYLAERADEQFHKRVAIKLIKRGLDTDAIQQRFRREREILASLEHPNIARLLDAGTTQDGLSYFVMEYVQGEIITEYCATHQLDIQQRLTLFRTVCDAVSYAHTHLVIHRDLKPSNILVNANGEPKLLDFGIAKLLGDEAELRDQTVVEQRPLTPEYASPEQLHGGAITTASDVYALGVVLHELLTGEKPKRGAHGDFVRASAVAANSKSLRGDLDNIVAKALQEEPKRRYSSARQLADEIERYQRGLPVLARGDAFSYRAAKFIRRHRFAVAATLLVGLSLVAGLIATEREARLAQREKQRTQRVNSFLAETLADAAPALNRRLHHGQPNSLSEVLDSASKRLDGNEFANEPEVRADLERVIGGAYAADGKAARADQHLQRWIAMAERLYPANHPKRILAAADRAGMLFIQGKLTESEAAFRNVIPKLRAECVKNQVEPEDYAEALNNFAYLRRTQGDSAEAERLFRQSLSVKTVTQAPFHHQLATTRSTLALTLQDEGKFAEALSTAREAVREKEQLDSNADETAFALTVLGGLLTENGEYAAADAALRRAEGMLRDLVAPTSLWLGDNLRNQAASFYAQGRYEDALRTSREASTIYQQNFGSHYDNYPTALDIEGLSLARTGNVAEGEKLLRDALILRETTLPHEHFWVALAQGALGEFLTLQKRYGEAEPLLVASYEGLRHSQGADNPRTKLAEQRLVEFSNETGRAVVAGKLTNLGHH